MKKTKLNNLYFGIRLFSLSYNNKSERKLETYNLFDFARVKWSVATYVLMSKNEKQAMLSSPLHFCFGDMWGRCEYEMLVRPMVSEEKDELKTDIFQMYVEPNKEFLMRMVESISKNSAREYLKAERKRLRGK